MTGKRFYSVNGYPVYLKKKFYNFFLKFSWKNSTEDTAIKHYNYILLTLSNKI